MSNVTVNISFQDDLLRDIDRVARSEARSRSELLREAARAYIERKEHWAGMLAMGRAIAQQQGVTPSDVPREIKAHRKSKASRQ